MLRGRHSLAWRLTVLFAVVSASLLTATGSLLFIALERLLAERDEAEVIAKLDLVRHHVAEVPDFGDRAELDHRLGDLVVAHPHLAVAVFGPSEAPIASPRPFPVSRSSLNARDGGSVRGSVPVVQSGARGGVFLLATGWSSMRGVEGGRVLIAVALDTSSTRALLTRYRFVALAAVAATTIIAVFLGIAVARIALRPLRKVVIAADSISASRLDHRLGSSDAPSEVVPLVRAIDNALTRLEGSFRQLSDFSSDLAHELRTPLHNLILQIQVALSRGRTAEDYRHVLESSLDELQHLSRMSSDMLFLARAESAQARLQTVPLNLRAEIDGVVEFYDALAEERCVQILCEGDATVNAERQLVRRAISNLLSNAIQHTSANGVVRITAGYDALGDAVVMVANTGKGIAKEQLGRVFDRFYRVDPIRGRGDEGAGLGLAIVRSIMALHGGEVRATSSPEGPTSFELRFPGRERRQT